MTRATLRCREERYPCTLGEGFLYQESADGRRVDAGRREILVAWGGLWPDWVLFMFTNRSCLPTCYDVLFSCYIRNQLHIRNACLLDNQYHFR